MLKTVGSTYGEKLRKVRENRGMTLKSLAECAGVSESLVSQIERNKVSPSIDTLLSLADKLQVDLDYLFLDYKKGHTAFVLREKDRSRLEKDGVTYQQLSVLPGHENQALLEAVLLEIEPLREKGSPEFGHEGQEIGIIIEGQGELHYGLETYTLKKGDTVSFSSDIPHVLRNSSSGPLKAIWIITPPKMNYFSEAAAVKTKNGGMHGKNNR